ncbi:hypothetical protein E1A91_A05G133300v1 [Gossypium mustelinum]|uniref:MAPK kinase substrate protein n=4 Tax=Gossypium TaxID=3633 RepID=A0A5J5VP53_GOSBA|nr:hypothetical protein ES319_A05G131200v1 [Gossypium barbadense]TYH16660.1 hypothetical protein ES288_A05G133500v1 [Gossypium darwinii]TYI26776.1 hypothetical protein ES332_A05G134600v1 [Gossypium tomentosum]TYJ33892.1 hypothetical protein E1A91_A05G133300v1 [Gossypium mustelinum]
MAGLQRSAVSFRRQGSSGLVWDDKFLSELNQGKPEEQQQGGDTKQLQKEEPRQLQDNRNPEKIDVVKGVAPINTIERNRSNGERRGYRTGGKVSPAIDPPSPKVSACGFCSALGKQTKNHRKKPDDIGDQRRTIMHGGTPTSILIISNCNSHYEDFYN